MRILLIEDNARLSSLTVAGLGKQGFAVDAVATVGEGLSALATTHFAAVILDLGLPDGDGLSILRQIRTQGLTIPVLILTARLSVGDRVKGLQDGADDYLGKPFALDELVARLRALLRRPASYLGTRLSLGRLAFDPVSAEIVTGQTHHPVPRREAAVLESLLRRANHVVPKKLLEDDLYGLSEDGSPNAVEVSVHRLRRQLAELRAGVAIHTVRGVGYLIQEAADE